MPGCPSAKVSFQYLHALMLSRLISIPGVTKDPIKLPFDFPAYLGTLSVIGADLRGQPDSNMPVSRPT